MKILKKDIKRFIIYILMLSFFFQPEFVTTMFPYIQTFFLGLELIVIVLILSISIKKRYLSKINIFIVLYFFILFIPTYFYNLSNMENFIKMIIPTIGLSLLCDFGIRYDCKIFLKSFETLLIIYLIINFITILLFPRGMYIGIGSGYDQNWFLGYRNSHILYMFPCIIVNFINSYIKFNKLTKKNLLLIIFLITSSILAKSSTTIVGISLMSVYLIFSRAMAKIKLFNMKNYFISYIIIYFSIIIARLQEIFSFIIIDILHKDITFTNRTFIWDYVIEFISKKPIIGYGYELGLKRYVKTRIYRSYHAHNQFLEIVYKSGILGAISFGIIMFLSFFELYKYRKENISKCLSFSFFVLMIMMLTEAYSFQYFIYLFVFAYNVKHIIIRENS